MEQEEQLLAARKRKCVLIFPPVSNYRRFLIHKVCEGLNSELDTFSIGQGLERRTVICFEQHLISKPVSNASSSNLNSLQAGASKKMVVDRQHISGCSTDTTSTLNGSSKKARPATPLNIYRPPAARRRTAELEVSTSDTSQNDPLIPKIEASRPTKQRRPDIQVYVPRAKRSSAPFPSSNSVPPTNHLKRQSFPRVKVGRSTTDKLTAKDHSKKLTACEPVPISSNIVLTTECNKPRETEIQTDAEQGNGLISTETDISNDKQDINPPTSIQIRCDVDSVVGNISSDSGRSTPSLTSEIREFELINELPVRTENTPCSLDDSCKSEDVNEINSVFNSYSSSDFEVLKESFKSSDSSVTHSNECLQITDEVLMKDNNEVLKTDSSKDSIHNFTGSDCVVDSNIENDVRLDDENTNHKFEADEESLQREEQNRINRQFFRDSVISDVLIISDPEPVVTNTPNEKCNVVSSYIASPEKETKMDQTEPKMKIPSVQSVPECECESSSPPLSLNRDECSWEMLFDDNGDCLDPKLIEELTSAVGSVNIEKPQSNYKSYQSKQEILIDPGDEFSHVVEIYNFPSSFVTEDLVNIFSPYKNGGFEIKWVDNTHALGVFSSALVAAEVLAAEHPFVKTRPLREASHESRMKAKRSAEFLQPYRVRPETCAALARRLVTGALGVKLSTSREEREAERKQLREAREKKRLAAKQRDEIWEGTITN